jgi:hypothetical protein
MAGRYPRAGRRFGRSGQLSFTAPIATHRYRYRPVNTAFNPAGKCSACIECCSYFAGMFNSEQGSTITPNGKPPGSVHCTN